jgi:transcriptional adapter 2-alpha
MDKTFEIEPEEFQERKRRRISEMNAKAPPPLKVAPTSAPGIHEIAGYLPGRLEFEHELDNEAEHLIKDLEFGVVMQYGGDEIIEDEEDLDLKARQKWIEERRQENMGHGRKTLGKGPMMGFVNGKTPAARAEVKQETAPKNEDNEEEEEEPTQPPPTETDESLAFKLTLLEMYAQRVEKRLEGKSMIINRGLLEYKKVCLSFYRAFL